MVIHIQQSLNHQQSGGTVLKFEGKLSGFDVFIHSFAPTRSVSVQGRKKVAQESSASHVLMWCNSEYTKDFVGIVCSCFNWFLDYL